MTTTERALLTESVHETLRELIFSGELAPGTPLSVPALASKLNVSRTPVREAVQQLIYEGIAVHTRNAGAKVDSLDAESLRAVFEVREVLRRSRGVQRDGQCHARNRVTAEQDGAGATRTSRELAGSASGIRSSTSEFHTLIRETACNQPAQRSPASSGWTVTSLPFGHVEPRAQSADRRH